MAVSLFFSGAAGGADVVRLADGRLAQRCANRAGRMGWLVYSADHVREAFFTDAQWARRGQ